MKLLKLPLDEDPVINRIRSLAKHIPNDESGKYVAELLHLLYLYCMTFPVDYSMEINKMEEKIREAIFWHGEYFESLWEEE